MITDGLLHQVARALHEERSAHAAAASAAATLREEEGHQAKEQEQALRVAIAAEQATSTHLRARVETLQREASQLAPATALDELRTEHAALQRQLDDVQAELLQARADVVRERALVSHADAKLQAAAEAARREYEGQRREQQQQLEQARQQVEQSSAMAAERDQHASRMAEFLKQKARETVGLDEARRAAAAAAQRAQA